jgi:hypothetical protein
LFASRAYSQEETIARLLRSGTTQTLYQNLSVRFPAKRDNFPCSMTKYSLPGRVGNFLINPLIMLHNIVGNSPREASIFPNSLLFSLLAGNFAPRRVTYYNKMRTHVSLGKDAPRTRLIERIGDVVAYPILGGLHHRYARI